HQANHRDGLRLQENFVGAIGQSRPSATAASAKFHLTVSPKVYVPIAILLRTEGRLISVSRRGAGSGGRGMPCSGDALRKGRAVQAAKHPGARSTSAEGPDGPSGTPVRGAAGLSAWSSTVVWALSPLIARLPGISRSRPTKHRARDAS